MWCGLLEKRKCHNLLHYTYIVLYNVCNKHLGGVVMEENKEEIKEPEQKQFSIVKMVNLLLPCVALLLFVVVKICMHFGVASTVFYGIMSIFAYSLTLAAAIWAYVREHKLTTDLWFCLAVFLVLALCF